MFYLLHQKRLLPIKDDNTYTMCPRCGRLFQIDLGDVFADGDADLYGTSVYCNDCSAAVRAEGLAATGEET